MTIAFRKLFVNKISDLSASISSKHRSTHNNDKKLTANQNLQRNIMRFGKEDTALALMYHLLVKSVEERNKEEIALVITILKEIPFFKDRQMSDSALVDVINVMKMLPMREGTRVMNYGDVGDNFYFILFGGVEVHIPDPNKLQRFKNL